MALLGSGFRDLGPLPLHYVGGVSGVTIPGNLRTMFARGDRRNQASAFGNLASTPDGVTHPTAWILPAQGGRMSSQVGITITTTAVGGMGMPGEGSASFSITVPDAAGEMIAFGEGSVTISITSNTPPLTASVGGEGSASFAITSTATIGAKASISGSSGIQFTVPAATIFPLSDNPVLREGTATITLSGTLTPYAIGIMEGTTEEAGLTNAGIATSVWAKVIEAGFSADQILRILAAQAAGAATGLEGANPQFKGLDGTTTRIDGSYSAGTRTIDSLNGD